MIVSLYTTDGQALTTGQLMHAMVCRYHNDMLPYSHLPVIEVYNKIKNLPYREDPIDTEVLMRPLYTMNNIGAGGDCDDKSIALASYAVLVLPKPSYRFIAVRRSDRITLHHVYPQLYISDRWVVADPTYRFNVFGRERERYAEYVVI